MLPTALCSGFLIVCSGLLIDLGATLSNALANCSSPSRLSTRLFQTALGRQRPLSLGDRGSRRVTRRPIEFVLKACNGGGDSQ